MLGFFVLGLALSIGHIVHYAQLNGHLVGDQCSQESNIRSEQSFEHGGSHTYKLLRRIVTAFAFISQIALTASVWLARTQWLWRSVKKTEMSVTGLNAAFGANTSVLALLIIEMLKKLKVAVMAFFACCLMLPPSSPRRPYSSTRYEMLRDTRLLAVCLGNVGVPLYVRSSCDLLEIHDFVTFFLGRCLGTSSIHPQPSSSLLQT
jgi:hypothetical protein